MEAAAGRNRRRRARFCDRVRAKAAPERALARRTFLQPACRKTLGEPERLHNLENGSRASVALSLVLDPGASNDFPVHLRAGTIARPAALSLEQGDGENGSLLSVLRRAAEALAHHRQ